MDAASYKRALPMRMSGQRSTRGRLIKRKEDCGMTATDELVQMGIEVD